MSHADWNPLEVGATAADWKVVVVTDTHFEAELHTYGLHSGWTTERVRVARSDWGAFLDVVYHEAHGPDSFDGPQWPPHEKIPRP